jgi:hypothetical protein
VLALGLGYVVANARQDRREGIGRTRNGPHDSPGAHSGRVLSLSPLTINP